MVFSACIILKQFLSGHFSPWHLRPPPSPGGGHLSASSSVTSFRLSRPVVPPELFWTTWLLRATFFCGFPRLLPSPSSVAALMMLLTGRGRKIHGRLTRPPLLAPGGRLCLWLGEPP